MSKEYKYDDVIKTDMQEACLSGDICEGICREMNYKNCPVHQRFYYEIRGKKRTKIYVFEKEVNK